MKLNNTLKDSKNVYEYYPKKTFNLREIELLIIYCRVFFKYLGSDIYPEFEQLYQKYKNFSHTKEFLLSEYELNIVGKLCISAIIGANVPRVETRFFACWIIGIHIDQFDNHVVDTVFFLSKIFEDKKNPKDPYKLLHRYIGEHCTISDYSTILGQFYQEIL